MAGTQNETGNQHRVGTPTAGDKHETDHEAPEAKRPKTEEKQTTLDESFSRTDGDNEKDGQKQPGEKDNDEQSKESTSQPTEKEDQGDSIEPGKEKNVPSNILEKGIVYFFIRGRVGIDEPNGVDEVARAYILLRPIEKDAKLGKGTLGDAGNTRILALPKKVLPASGKDRFMVFVDKTGASFEEIKEEFLSSSDYETKTAGTRHTPGAAPTGEGVYAITTTGRESHLAYMLTLPEELGSAQKDLGLKEKGSFILSTKNPKQEGPANAQLPEGPGYPKEIQEEFRSLRWMPTQPKHLDYANAQVLLIGESSGLDKATEPQKKDKENDKEEPIEVLEHLEEEDEERMKDLAGDQSQAIFADLEASAKNYPKLQTTFS